MSAKKQNTEPRVCVLSPEGEPLMPCRPSRARKLVRDGKATVVGHRPYTIQLTEAPSDTRTEKMELKVDSGYLNIGISICSENEELLSEQRICLPDEKRRHDSQRKYRRKRRHKLRHRAVRRNRGSQCGKTLAPSLQHKVDAHLQLIARYLERYPISDLIVETAAFNPSKMREAEMDEPSRKAVEALRAAVFARDGYTCQICGRTAKDGTKLRAHHMLYWQGRHGNQLDEMLCVCDKCHSSANHKPGGALWGLRPKQFIDLAAASGTTVIGKGLERILEQLDGDGLNVIFASGSDTKVSRQEMGLAKSHANDAYAMGELHPAVRAKTRYYKKRRRNNRVLSRFCDARYIDIRDGKMKSAQELGCERTRRGIPRNNPESLRAYRGEKVRSGSTPTRRRHFLHQKGDIIRFEGRLYECGGASKRKDGYSVFIILDDGSKIQRREDLCPIVIHAAGWLELNDEEISKLPKQE